MASTDNIGRVGTTFETAPGDAGPISAGDPLTQLFSRALGEDLFRLQLQRQAQQAMIQDLGLSQFLAQQGVRPGQASGIGRNAASIDAARPTGPAPGGAEDVLASRLVQAQTNAAILEELNRIKEASKPSLLQQIAGPLFGLAGLGVGASFGEPAVGATAGNLFGELLNAGGY